MGPKLAGDWLKLADGEPEAQAVAQTVRQIVLISYGTLKHIWKGTLNEHDNACLK